MAKKKKNKYTVNILWKDRRRRLGMPLSFQRYRLGEDRLFYEKGFLSTSVDDILLYRVRDISVKISFWQRLTGVGTVTVNSSDQTMPVLVMRDIKRPREVKEILVRNSFQCAVNVSRWEEIPSRLTFCFALCRRCRY